MTYDDIDTRALVLIKLHLVRVGMSESVGLRLYVFDVDLHAIAI